MNKNKLIYGLRFLFDGILVLCIYTYLFEFAGVIWAYIGLISGIGYMLSSYNVVGKILKEEKEG